MPMFHRIIVNIIAEAFKGYLIADRVFPKPALPHAALSLAPA